MTSAEIATAVGGVVHGPDAAVDGAVIDSRLDCAGRLFVPIVGERDGHDFVDDALARGATAYLTHRPPTSGTAIQVDDTAAALTALGQHARTRLPDRVVGVTGSVGKTSVKDLLAAALAPTFATSASVRSFNNELGVPLTLVDAPENTEAVVVEMGARGIGHIAALCDVARPTIGIVTAVGHVHTELFGTIDDVARGKSELVASLPPHGTAVLNNEDERVRAMASPASRITYGAGGDVVAADVVLDDELRPRFTVRSPWGTTDVRLAARGAHQVGNALAALAAACAAGAPLDQAAAGLADAVLSPWRMELGRSPAGALVINDAYNANPISVRAALRSLAALDADRRIAVLGTMAELGDVADDEHRAIAAEARHVGIRLIAVDEERYAGADHVADVEAAADALGDLRQGDAVLVKGSRVAGLERLAALLLGSGRRTTRGPQR